MSSVSFALVAVAGGAACSGAATVLQARAARREPERDGLDASLLVRLLRRPGYILALVLVAAGFGLGVLAMQTLPLFIVQAGRASSLAVTAILAVAVLGARLRRRDVAAVAVVVAGLVLLGAAAADDRLDHVLPGTRAGLLMTLLVVAAVGAAATRLRSRAVAGAVLGALAGVAFAVLALGARILHGFAPAVLLGDAAAWAIAAGGTLGLLLAAMALQRTSVVGATAPMVAVETVLGAVLGVVLCGDRPASGGVVPAVVGFVLVLTGALGLARFAGSEPVAARTPDAVGRLAGPDSDA
jgi:drug/metabolite transporter (DMT)-like permease